MKRRSVARAIGLCLAGTGLFLFASTANAAPAPEGSYQQSCRNFAASHGTLSAECKNTKGDWNNTQLSDYRSCSGDISNNNGQLTCTKSSGTPAAAGPSGQGPAGTSGQGSGATGGQGSGGTGGQGSGATGGQGSAGTGGQGPAGTGGQGPSGTGGQGSSGTGGQGSGAPGGQGPTGTGGQGSGATGHGDDHSGDRTRHDNDSGAGAPQGSYKDTCRNAHIEGDNLIAECRTSGGDWHRTSLDNYRQCRGDIFNSDGGLRCRQGDEGRGGRGDEDRGAPAGSYKDTCRNVHMDGDNLVAECRTRDGDWHRTSLDNYRECRGDISNDDGRLRCRRGDEDHGGRGNDDHGGYGGGNEPAGSYAQTCRNIRAEHGDLEADCRNRDGDWHHSSLDNYRDCKGDVFNDDGRLRCRQGDEDHGGGYQPRGSYQQSCGNIRVDRGALEADCRTRRGDWRHSSLDNFRDCRRDIANDNGRLVCSGGGGYGNGRITLYVDSKYRGGRRSYDSDVPDLGDFSDTASSAYVQGGVWQLCTRRNYRGRCVTLNHNVSNFAPWGINDRVESLRRVR
jgi:hypothetical protein